MNIAQEIMAELTALGFAVWGHGLGEDGLELHAEPINGGERFIARVDGDGQRGVDDAARALVEMVMRNFARLN